MFRILFQGDSLTDACRDKECKDVDTNKRLGVGYVNHVAAYLMSVTPEIRVKNNGVNGNRIVDLYARWTEDTLNEEFDLLSILCGVNDVGFQLRLNRGVETEKYRYIYDRTSSKPGTHGTARSAAAPRSWTRWRRNTARCWCRRAACSRMRAAARPAVTGRWTASI